MLLRVAARELESPLKVRASTVRDNAENDWLFL